MSVRDEAVGGIAWTGAARSVRIVLHFGVTVVLARMLTPEDFGLLAMITVLTNFALLFGELGFSAALIQRTELAEGHRSSVFWLTLGLGCLLTGSVYSGAPAVASFYDEPELELLTRVLAANFMLAALKVVQVAVLTRAMRFRAIGVAEVCATFGGGAIGIGAALTGHGVWSLVAQLLATTAIESLGLWLTSGWRPRLRFDGAAVRELLPFGANFVGFSIVNYWMRNADNLLIGRFVGSAGLGIYERAYHVMLLPVTQASGVLTRVMFPTLSKLQGQPSRVKALYLRSIRAISLLTFPMMLGLLVVADHFVLAVFGPRWTEVTPILRILCVVGLLQSVTSTTGWLFQSQGRTDQMFRWGLFSGAVTLVAFAIGIRWGVQGVAIAYALRTIALTPPSFGIPGRLVGMRLSEVAKALVGTLACAGAMAAALVGVRTLVPSDLSVYAALALEILSGVALFAAIVLVVRLEALGDVRDAVARYRSSSR